MKRLKPYSAEFLAAMEDLFRVEDKKQRKTTADSITYWKSIGYEVKEVCDNKIYRIESIDGMSVIIIHKADGKFTKIKGPKSPEGVGRISDMLYPSELKGIRMVHKELGVKY